MYVLGTAGHIDHGKSSLVKAMTGIDPDRLREEKERGMTIDLGFAWMKLPGGREVGIVDVPGHERFVRNMLAGVGGIDLAMLVIAANESVMPQTREHLAILDLLQVRRGIIVINKKDLVDAELLSLVKMEIEELVSATTLAGAPVVAVSALTRDGIPELLATIDTLLEGTEPRRDTGHPRLPIDRVFTIAGAGTVVTGTLIDGSLNVGQEVEIVPSGLKSRLRGLQTHKSKLNNVTPGSRVAANLVGLNVSELKRGDIVTTPGWLVPTQLLTVKLRMLSYLERPLKHSTEISVYVLASETLAKVRLLEADNIKPGQSAWAQLTLEQPIAAINGDRYIIRSTMETLGGGEIIDAHPERLRRFRPEVIQNLEARESGTAGEAIIALLETKQPLEMAALVSQGSLPAPEAEAMIKSLVGQGKLVNIGQGENFLLFTAAEWERQTRRAVSIVQEYHQKFPTRTGMPKVELVSRLKLGTNGPAAVQKLVSQGVIVEEGTLIRLPAFRTHVTAEQQKQLDVFLNGLAQNPYSPPTDQMPPPDLLNFLAEQGKVVKVSDSMVFPAAAYEDMVKKVTAHIKTHGKITLGETRDLFGTSRKYAQALLEYLDGKKVTRRVGDERVMY